MTLLATSLPRSEFEVNVAVLSRTGPYEQELRDAEVPFTLIDKSLKIDPFAFGRLKKLIRSFKPDIVHTWLFAGNSYGRYAAIQCNVPRIIAGERCVDPWKSRLHFKIDKWLERKTDAIATNSTGVVDFYASHGFDPSKFKVIPNAVEPFPPSKLTKAKLLEAIGLTPEILERNRVYSKEHYFPTVENPEPLNPNGPYLIGVIARLWPQKRIKEAVWIADVLKAAALDFHLLIIGDGPERESLLRYRDLINIADRVHFLGARNDVSNIIPHLDLLWNLSEYEGQSNSILEAMACGVPVIATDIPGNRDLIVPGETGILIPDCGEDYRRRRSGLGRRSIQLLESATRRRKMGEAAKKRIEMHFSLQKMINAYAELYSEI